jgi:hypothetical protein
MIRRAILVGHHGRRWIHPVLYATAACCVRRQKQDDFIWYVGAGEGDVELPLRIAA